MREGVPGKTPGTPSPRVTSMLRLLTALSLSGFSGLSGLALSSGESVYQARACDGKAATEVQGAGIWMDGGGCESRLYFVTGAEKPIGPLRAIWRSGWSARSRRHKTELTFDAATDDPDARVRLWYRSRTRRSTWTNWIVFHQRLSPGGSSGNLEVDLAPGARRARVQVQWRIRVLPRRGSVSGRMHLMLE